MALSRLAAPATMHAAGSPQTITPENPLPPKMIQAIKPRHPIPRSPIETIGPAVRPDTYAEPMKHPNTNSSRIGFVKRPRTGELAADARDLKLIEEQKSSVIAGKNQLLRNLKNKAKRI